MLNSVISNECTPSSTATATMVLAKTLEELKAGKPILLYDADGREEETDIVVASQFMTPELMFMLRRDAGGLICTAIPTHVHE